MNVEVRPVGSPALHPRYEQIEWGGPDVAASDMNSSVDAWLSQLGAPSGQAIDLVRLAGAAYIADRLRRRGEGFSRTMRVHVHLTDHTTWIPLLPKIERLLSWVSGDSWDLSISSEAERQTVVGGQVSLLSDRAEMVSLLSGGLDSFSGSILQRPGGLFLSHTDNPTVTGTQIKVWNWLTKNGVTGECVRISLSEATRRRENSTRTRAILFYALAVASADARGINRVEVPENGFTGLNLSLGNDRGGVLSTRSTHPWTIYLVQELLHDVAINIDLVNPYEWHTKGELVGEAARACPTFVEGLGSTLSCAKLDGRTYKGGNPNLNCGLCVACLTRRAAIMAAGVADPTPYLATTLKGSSLEKLHSRRRRDVLAVMSRVESDIDEWVLLENGPYPEDYDLGAAADLCTRGFAEFRALLAELS